MTKGFRKGMAVVLTAALALSTPVALDKTAAKAAEVSTPTDYSGNPQVISWDGAGADENGWNSTDGDSYAIEEGKVGTVTFTNEPFLKDGAYENFYNFIIETNAPSGTKGITLRADAYGWTYGDGTNEPAYTVEKSWGTEDWGEGGAFAQASEGTITVSADQTDDNTVVFSIVFGENVQTETYTVTYPSGVPDGLMWHLGVQNAKVSVTKYEVEQLPCRMTAESTLSLILDANDTDAKKDKVNATVKDYVDDETNYEGATKYYKSSKESVATVAADGTVTAVGNGTATITSYVGSDSDSDIANAKAKATTEVTVTTNASDFTVKNGTSEVTAPIELKVDTYQKNESSVYKANTTEGVVTLSAEVTPETATADNYTIVWSVGSSDESKVNLTPSPDGKTCDVSLLPYSGIKAGDQIVVTATVTNKEGYTTPIEKTATVKVVLNEIDYTEAEAVSLTADASALTAAKIGTPVDLTVAVTGEEGAAATNQDVTWNIFKKGTQETYTYAEVKAGTAAGSYKLNIKDGAKDGDEFTVQAVSEDVDTVKSDALNVKVSVKAETESISGKKWWNASNGVASWKADSVCADLFTVAEDGTATAYLYYEKEVDAYPSTDNKGMAFTVDITDSTEDVEGSWWTFSSYGDTFGKGSCYVGGAATVQEGSVFDLFTVGHLYKIAITGVGTSNASSVITDCSDDNKEIIKYTGCDASALDPSSGLTIAVYSHFGTYLLVNPYGKDIKADKLVSDVKAVKNANGTSIDLSYKLDAAAEAVEVKVNGEKVATEGAETNEGVTTLNYPVTEAGTYEFTVTGTKEETKDNYYIPTTASASIELVEVGGKLYEITDEKLITTDLAVKKSDDGYDISWATAADVTATCTVAETKSGKTVKTLTAPGKVANSELTANTAYTVTLIATKGDYAQKNKAEFTYTVKQTTNDNNNGTANNGTANNGTANNGTANSGSSTAAASSGTSNKTTTTAKKKTMKLSAVKVKKGTKKITGKVSVKKATVKIKVGKKKYKKAKVSGKKFTLKTSKLKKGTKVTIKVTKSGYKTLTKTYKVK
jgi:hypothetical protein